MKEEIVEKTQRLKGFNQLGILINRAKLNNGTYLRGFSLVFLGKQVLMVSIANDKGWYGKDKKVYNFFYDKKKNRLFIRKLAIGFPFLKRK